MNGMIFPSCIDLCVADQHFFSAAAYQVGLSFLTMHMRRAVAACTSPEVFFASTPGVEGLVGRNGPIMDPLGLAMDALDITTP